MPFGRRSREAAGANAAAGDKSGTRSEKEPKHSINSHVDLHGRPSLNNVMAPEMLQV
jgi:hypothetical protein